MFKNILVPLDGSNLSEVSLAPAAYLAKTLKSQITLFHVIEQAAPAEVHKERHLTQPEEANAYLKEVAERAFPTNVEIKTHVHTAAVSNVAFSIVDHEPDLKFDLIVICTHGRGGVRDLLYGSIAQQVVALGTVPLLVIKTKIPSFELKKILIPLDPDSLHDNSVIVAEGLAKIFEAELHLLSIIPTLSTLGDEQSAAGNLMPATTQAYLDLKVENVKKDLQNHVDALHKYNLKATAEVARGDPASLIVKAAEQSGADLIILSTHRKAGMGAFWARSVAPKVAQKTKTPLLLIPLSQKE
jgi:nucleotide-binding universal stress UspA family protein